VQNAFRILSLGLVLLFCPGCVSLLRNVTIKLIYHKSEWPVGLTVRDVPYLKDTLPKHRLDLFRPKQPQAPILIFVHGGGWTEGDKALAIGDVDVYGNIGRYYASQGILTAIINYRLLNPSEPPGDRSLTLDDQLSDVASSVAWVHKNAKTFGGDANKVFLMGHSAGAQLIAHLALRPDWLKEHALPFDVIKGTILVSAAGLDLKQAPLETLEKNPNYYTRRLADTRMPTDWRVRHSPITYLHKEVPPFLLMYADGEYGDLKTQIDDFHQALLAHGVNTKKITVGGENHEKMVLVLSHPRKSAVPAILDFIKK
jgi:acetyl esterase/lipase